jgi:hypothetical protein
MVGVTWMRSCLPENRYSLRVPSERFNVLLDPFDRQPLIKESSVLLDTNNARHAREAKYVGAIAAHVSNRLAPADLLGGNNNHVFLICKKLAAVNGVVGGSFGKA